MRQSIFVRHYICPPFKLRRRNWFWSKYAISPISMAYSVFVSVCLCVTFVRTCCILMKIKMLKITFIDYDIYHWMMQLRKLYSVALTHFSRSNILNVNITKTLTTSEKMHTMTFVYFHICYGMTPLRMLHP